MSIWCKLQWFSAGQLQETGTLNLIKRHHMCPDAHREHLLLKCTLEVIFHDFCICWQVTELQHWLTGSSKGLQPDIVLIKLYWVIWVRLLHITHTYSDQAQHEFMEIEGEKKCKLCVCVCVYREMRESELVIVSHNNQQIMRHIHIQCCTCALFFYLCEDHLELSTLALWIHDDWSKRPHRVCVCLALILCFLCLGYNYM